MDQEKFISVIRPHLSADEDLRAVALGVTSRPLWLMFIALSPAWIILILLWTGNWPRQWNLIFSVLIGCLIGLLLGYFIATKIIKIASYIVVGTNKRLHFIELQNWKSSVKSHRAWNLTEIRRGTVVQNQAGVTLHFYPPGEHIELLFSKAAPITGNDNLALKLDRLLSQDPKILSEQSGEDDPFTAVSPVKATASVAVPEGSALLVSDSRGWRCSACNGYVRRDASFCKHCRKPFVQLT